MEGLGQDFATLYRQVSSVSAETALRCGSFPPTQKSFDSDSALLPKLYGITSWVMLRVQDGGGEAATSCFL